MSLYGMYVTFPDYTKITGQWRNHLENTVTEAESEFAASLQCHFNTGVESQY